MTNQLLLHKNTSQQINDILSKPPQAILIVGPPGSGKASLASYLAARLMNIEPAKLSSRPYYMLIEKPHDKSEIPIDSVRKIIRSLSLKSPGDNQKINRIVNIKDAELLSEEAQNALLKIIEEPPPQTVFILSAPSADAVLPTIVSRAQRLTISPLNLTESSDFFKPTYTSRSISSAWSLSQGAAGLMSAILKDEIEHPLKQAVERSKQFLKLDAYERLIFLDSLSSDEGGLEAFLDGLSRVLKELHRSSIESGRTNQAGKLLKSRRLVNEARSSLSKNASTRLVGLNLVLHLPI